MGRGYATVRPNAPPFGRARRVGRISHTRLFGDVASGRALRGKRATSRQLETSGPFGNQGGVREDDDESERSERFWPTTYNRSCTF